MKKILILLLLFFSLSGCAKITTKVYVKPEFEKGNIKRIAVSQFEGFNGGLLSDMFTAELKKLGRFEIVENSQVIQVLNEIMSKKNIFKLQGSSNTNNNFTSDLATLKEVSGILNIDAILAGSTIRTYSTLELNTRLVDIKTGNLLWNSTYTINYEDSAGYISKDHFQGAVNNTVKKLKEALIPVDVAKSKESGELIQADSTKSMETKKRDSAELLPVDLAKSKESKKQEPEKTEDKVYAGMSKEDLYNIFSKKLQKGYLNISNEEWITFDNLLTKKKRDTVTFYLKDGKVESWLEAGGNKP